MKKMRFGVLAVSMLSGYVAFAPLAAFADDALTLPEGVFRFTSGTATVSGTQGYDANGQRNDLAAPLNTKVQSIVSSTLPVASAQLSIFREDLAFEYGLTDKLVLSLRAPLFLNADVKVTQNAAMQGTMASFGAYPVGTIPQLLTKLGMDGHKASTLGDMILGVKYQWAHSGSNPIAAEPGTYRAAIALGGNLPTGTLADPTTNDISTTHTWEAKSWILGARTYWDYQFTEDFYLNFYTEHEYRMTGDTQVIYQPTAAMSTYQVLNAQCKPGFYNHLEADLAVQPTILKDLKSESGIKATADFTGAPTYYNVPTDFAPVTTNANSYSSFNLVPYIGVFYTGMKMPVKFKMAYVGPLGGSNTYDVGGMAYILQGFLKF